MGCQVFWARRKAGSVRSVTLEYLTDHLGTARDLVADTGEVLNHRVFDAYGNLLGESDTSGVFTTRYAFTGRELDAATGLHFYRARYYDANTGRFLSEDPIGFGGRDTSLYRYVGNTPNTHADPTGASSWWYQDLWWGVKHAVTSPLETSSTFYGSEIPRAYSPVVDAAELLIETPANAAIVGRGLFSSPLETAREISRGSLDAQTLMGLQGVDAVTSIGAGIANLPLLAGNGVGWTTEFLLEGLGVEVCREGYGYFEGTDFAADFSSRKGLLEPGEQGLSTGATNTALQTTLDALGLRTKPLPKSPATRPLPDAPATPKPRLPQDIAVDPTPPRRLPLNRPISQSATQNNAAQGFIQALKKLGHKDILVNQQQVNARQQRVGINRPDVQSTGPDGRRYYFEWDKPGSSRGVPHRDRILANDPDGDVTLFTTR